MENLYTKVKNIVDRGVNVYVKTINKDKHLVQEIIDNTSFLNDDASMSERVYCILNPSKIPNKCINGNMPLFNTFKKGYRKFCGSGKQCECKILDQSDKIKELIKNNPEIITEREKKRKETCLERYDETHPMKTEEGKKKHFEKYKEKTGYDTPMHNPEVVEKSKKSTLASIGSERPFENKKFRKECTDKAMSLDPTMNIPRTAYKEQTGYDNPSLNPIDRQKQIDGMISNHGVPYPLQSDSIKENMRKKETEEYNRNHCTQRNISDEIWEIINDKEKLQDLVNTKSVKEISEMFEHKNVKSTYGRLKELGITFPRSSYEIEIKIFLESNGINFIHGDRQQIKPKELDFYLPDYNLAIEFNGIYWHSDIFKENDYHLKKYLACNEKGIRLISINEDEWVKNNSLIKSKILNLLGKSEKGISARKTSIREIPAKEANDFCEKYHIQGKTPAIIYSIGAFDDCGVIVGVMSFSKQRTTGDVELIRFCHDGKIHSGLFSKMLKFSIKNNNWNKIISFADLRYSDGNLYKKTGFVEESIIKPDYKYVYNNETFHKSNFKKDKIKHKFKLTEEYVNSKTERELMEEQGYVRLYDIGKIKYVMNL